MSLDKGVGEATWTAQYLMYSPTVDYRKGTYKEVKYRNVEGTNMLSLSAQASVSALPEASEIDEMVQECIKGKMPQTSSTAISMRGGS